LLSMEEEVVELEAAGVDQKKEFIRVQAAQSIKPGCAQWVLASWMPRESKPQRKHLQDEVLRRGGTAAKSWSPQQLADWLHLMKEPAEPSPSPTLQDSVDELRSANAAANSAAVLPTTAGQHPSEGAGNVVDECRQRAAPLPPAPPHQRWYANRQGARLLHVILEMKDEFVLRDQGHRSRNEKDSAARNSFWVKATAKFNDSTFLPSCKEVLHRVEDSATQLLLEEAHIDPSLSQYIGTPDKLEKEFNSMRAQLEPCLVNFRLSGMGDCPAEEKHAQSFKVYSSKFSHAETPDTPFSETAGRRAVMAEGKARPLLARAGPLHLRSPRGWEVKCCGERPD